jgi:adhesin/invasin
MILNDCGSAIRSGSVVASFSNNDPSLTLRSQLDGHWSATWAPRTPQANSTVTVTAQQPEINVQGTVQVSGVVPDTVGVPALNVGPMVSSASYLGRPSPGELVAVFGSNLSDGLAVSAVLPLQTQLQGSLLIFGGRQMPLLYTSPLQVNAMVPYSIAPGITYQLIAQRGTRLSVPQEVTVASVEPAVFTTDSSVNGQGHIYINVSATQVRADSAMPAKAGDVLTIYCEGLGAVVPAIDAGAAVDRLTKTVNPVGVTIGGVPSTVLFAGLTPGFTGLYQVNVIVPNGIAPGNAVPVVLSIASVSSPSVTIAVQ